MLFPVEILLEIASKRSPKDLLKFSHSSSFLYRLVKFHLKKVVEFPQSLNIYDPVLVLFSMRAGSFPIYPNGQTILAKASQKGLLNTIDMCKAFDLIDQKDVYGLYAANNAKNYATLDRLFRLGYSTCGVLDSIIPKWNQRELLKAVGLIGNSCTNKSVIHAISRNFRFLVQKLDVSNECLHESVKSSSTFKITQDLVSRCDINSQGFQGLTALHFAVKMKNVKAIQILVEEGASLDVKTSCGKKSCARKCVRISNKFI
jgi:Ankyrin repeat